MKLDDELLSRAAILVRDKQLQQLSNEQEYPQHIFSEHFEQTMQNLLNRVARGEVQQKKAALGWPYYVRQGIAAVLLCFAITFMAAPDVVIAGYHEIVEVIETVFEEYTEYHTYSNAPNDAVFEQVKINYLPEGLEITEQETGKNNYTVTLVGAETYFTLEQTPLTEDDGLGYILDTEDAQIEKEKIGQDEILFILKRESYQYVWIHENYIVSGQSNLDKREITKILENITFS